MTSAKTLRVPGYQVTQFLGTGARSTIWQIRDYRTNDLFALKRVVKRDVTDTRFLEQAVNEYDVASRFDHPSIRRMISIRRIKRWLSLREVHLVMEFCHGKTLQDERPQLVAEVLRIFTQVAKALAYVNANGYVHADTKPNNIIVAPDGEVKIIDMGQSCPIGTVKQRIQGTPDFIAPEQVNRRPLDGRTDMFNFGASLYWTLTARPIPTALPKAGAALLKAERNIPPPDVINPEVPSTLSKLISDCIEPQPARRLASMNEVVSRLALIAHALAKNGGQAEPAGLGVTFSDEIISNGSSETSSDGDGGRQTFVEEIAAAVEDIPDDDTMAVREGPDRPGEEYPDSADIDAAFDETQPAPRAGGAAKPEPTQSGIRITDEILSELLANGQTGSEHF